MDPVKVADSEKIRGEIETLVRRYSESLPCPSDFVPGYTPVTVSGKTLGPEELVNMVHASLDGWLTTGRFNTAFENCLADYLKVKNVMTTNSGSSANLLAFSTLTSPKLRERAIQKVMRYFVAAGFHHCKSNIANGAVPVLLTSSRALTTLMRPKLNVR